MKPGNKNRDVIGFEVRGVLLPGQQVLSIADRALYLGKMSGRNAWVGIYSNENTPLDDLLDRIHNDLERLDEQGTIVLKTSLADRESLVWKRA